MAFEELLSWSAQDARPEWQRDALRRIAVSGELTDDDLLSLRQIIEKKVGLIEGEIPEASPLLAEHLIDLAADAPRTILGSIGPVRRIDRLASDQPPIRFAKRGVTLVYGANASGKSGYCRIAKQLCRSVSTQELKGDVYKEAPADPPEVDLVYGIEGSKPERREVTWRRGDLPPHDLSRISVFDTDAARVYVDRNRKVEFLPYELDLLNKLGLAARKIDSEFEKLEDALEAVIKTPLPTGYNEDTAVSQVLAKLSPDSDFDELPDEATIRSLAVWDQEREVQLQAIVDKIGDDPATRLSVHRVAKQGLENVRAELLESIALLGQGGVGKLVEAHEDMALKAEAAEAAARGLSEGLPIPQIGSAAWRQMLIYAREFAGEAFPESDDPKLVSAQTCVLCQQPLGADASDRMARFDAYVSGRAAKASAEAADLFNSLSTQLTSMRVLSAAKVVEMLAAYAGLSEERNAFVDKISELFKGFAARSETIKRLVAENSFDELRALEVLPDDPIEAVAADIEALQAQIEELEDAGADSKRLATLLKSKAEMDDARRLSQEIEIVVERREQLARRLRVREARRQSASTPIARQLTTRRRALLTENLKTQLAKELKALRLSHIPIDLSDRSAGGESFVEVGLTVQQRVRNNSDVLSEGEQRALALCCFLAELNEVGAEHGIIIDDPVSSLDHSRMEAVAKRLVLEAVSGRQVIIFTHNIVFQYMVENEARRSGIPCHAEWMSSIGGTKFGIIDDTGKPPHTKKTKQRIGELEQAKASLFKKGYDPANSNDFRDDVISIYTRMRETWEQVVEEIIFNGSIQRFRAEIMTQSLRSAAFDPEADYPAIYEGMKRCSHFSGHDRADELPDGLPTEEEIEVDMKALVDFRDKVAKRKSALESGHKYEEGVEPEFL